MRYEDAGERVRGIYQDDTACGDAMRWMDGMGWDVSAGSGIE